MIHSARREKGGFEMTELARFFNGEQVMARRAYKMRKSRQNMQFIVIIGVFSCSFRRQSGKKHRHY
jgi:hypothetical protein